MSRIDVTCPCAVCCNDCSICLIQYGYEQTECLRDIFIGVAAFLISFARCCSLLNTQMIPSKYQSACDTSVKPPVITINLIKNDL